MAGQNIELSESTIALAQALQGVINEAVAPIKDDIATWRH